MKYLTSCAYTRFSKLDQDGFEDKRTSEKKLAQYCFSYYQCNLNIKVILNELRLTLEQAEALRTVEKAENDTHYIKKVGRELHLFQMLFFHLSEKNEFEKHIGDLARDVKLDYEKKFYPETVERFEKYYCEENCLVLINESLVEETE